jgi:hypothetical protein
VLDSRGRRVEERKWITVAASDRTVFTKAETWDVAGCDLHPVWRIINRFIRQFHFQSVLIFETTTTLFFFFLPLLAGTLEITGNSKTLHRFIIGWTLGLLLSLWTFRAQVRLLGDDRLFCSVFLPQVVVMTTMETDTSPHSNISGRELFTRTFRSNNAQLFKERSILCGFHRSL